MYGSFLVRPRNSENRIVRTYFRGDRIHVAGMWGTRKGLRRKGKSETSLSVPLDIENVAQNFQKMRALGEWSERAIWKKATANVRGGCLMAGGEG